MRLVGNLHAEMLLGLFLRGAGAVSSFALLWLIARIFGADVVGLYQIGLITVVLVGTAAGLGLPELIIRKVANLIRQGALGDARTTFLACSRYVLKRGIVGAGLMALLAAPFSRYVLGEPRAAMFLIIFAPAVLFLAFLRLTNALLRTAGHVMISQSLEGVFYTTLAAAGLALAWSVGMSGDPLLPVWLYQIGFAIAVLISWVMAKRVMESWPVGSALIGRNDGILIAAAPITAYAGDWLLLLILTTFLGIEEAGIYRTAFQFCMLFQLVNSSFAVMAGPYMARAAGERDAQQVRRIVRSAGLIGLAICLPLAIAGWIAPAWLLGLFGPEFRQGALGLQILLLGQIINVGIGPVGTALVMLHRERYVLVLEVVATAAGVLAALVLVERLGIAGVAAGTLIASAIRNLANYAKMHRVLGRLQHEEADAVSQTEMATSVIEADPSPSLEGRSSG